MVQRVRKIKAETGETANCCYKLAYLYTDSLIYLGEPHDLEYALRQAHDPGFDAMMTATAYRKRTVRKENSAMSTSLSFVQIIFIE